MPTLNEDNRKNMETAYADKQDDTDISIQLLGLDKIMTNDEPPVPVLDTDNTNTQTNANDTTDDINNDDKHEDNAAGSQVSESDASAENQDNEQHSQDIEKKDVKDLTPADIDKMSIQQKTDIIRFIDKIDENHKNKIIKERDFILEKFINDENSINHYGDKVIARVNQIVDNKLSKVSSDKDMNYPEINKLIRDMTGEFTEQVDDYQSTSFDLNKSESAVKKWFKKKMDAFKKNRFDAQSLNQRFDYVKAKLASNNAKLSDNISWGQQLIRENNNAIDNLIILTASIEGIRDEAERRARELQKQLKETDITNPEWHRIDDERTALAVIIHDLDIKHNECVVRLFDAHATNAQIRNIIAISQGIKQKSSQVETSVIPQMKLVISEIEATMQAKSSAELIQSVQDSAEAARHYLNKASLENTKYSMDIAESPTQSAQSIMERAQSIEAQNNELIASIIDGTRRRREVEQAVVTGVQLIDKSVRDRDRRIIDALMGEVGETPQITK